jgi:hypothetical protein
MNELAPSSNQEYKDHYPNAVENADKAHSMALESHKKRSEAARTRAVNRLLKETVVLGPDNFGRSSAEQFAERVSDAEQTLYPQKYIGVSEDMQRPKLAQDGLHGESARVEQLNRLYDARNAVSNSGGDAEKATEQIADWATHLDSEADKIEDIAAAGYDSRK